MSDQELERRVKKLEEGAGVLGFFGFLVLLAMAAGFMSPWPVLRCPDWADFCQKEVKTAPIERKSANPQHNQEAK